MQSKRKKYGLISRSRCTIMKLNTTHFYLPEDC